LIARGASAATKLARAKVAAEFTAHESVRRYLSSEAGFDPIQIQPPDPTKGGLVLKSRLEMGFDGGQSRERTFIKQLTEEERRKIVEEQQKTASSAFKFGPTLTFPSSPATSNGPVLGFSFDTKGPPKTAPAPASPAFAFSFGSGEVANTPAPTSAAVNQGGPTNPTSFKGKDPSKSQVAPGLSPSAFQFSFAPSTVSFDVSTLQTQVSFEPKKKDRSFKQGSPLPTQPSSDMSTSAPPK
jgi:hypothetical protein